MKELEGKEEYSAKDIANVKKALRQAEEWWAKGKELNPKSAMGSAARKRMEALIDKMEASRAGPPRSVSRAGAKDTDDGIAGKFESLLTSALERLQASFRKGKYLVRQALLDHPVYFLSCTCTS